MAPPTLTQQIQTILQGWTSQNGGNNSSLAVAGSLGSQEVQNSDSVVAPGTALPMDVAGRPGYLAADQPGGNPSSILVPGGQYSNSDNNVLLVGAPAGTAGGGGQYPQTTSNPVPIPWLASGWTNQQTDIDNEEYELYFTAATPGNGAHTVTYGGYTFVATGGEGALTYSAPFGMPDSMTLSSGGAMAGTPPVAGTFTFQVRVTDGEGNHADVWVTWTVT